MPKSIVRCVVFFLVAAFVAISSHALAGQERTLRVYTWTDYFDLEVVYEFERRNGCRVTLDYFDSGDAMYAKLKAQGGGYDVVISPSYMSAIMKLQGMIRDIDHAALPNLKHIDRSLAALTEDPGMAYSVPYTRVVSGVGYNRKRVGPGDIGSWDIFGKTAYAKRMTLANDVRETLGAALKYLGHSLNTTDADELSAAGDLLVAWKPNLAKFEIDEAKLGLVTGEFTAVHSYNGDIALVMQESADIDFFFPREGASLAVDGMVIAAGAENPELAHAFLNHMLEPEMAAENMIGIRYYMPNPDAIRLLPDELRDTPTFKVPEDVLEKCEVIRDLGADNAKYIDVWNRVKGAE